MASDIFAIAGSALDAQNTRMAAIASNLANADSVAAPGGTPYRAREVIFQAAPADEVADAGLSDADGAAAPDMGVAVAGTVESNAPATQTYDPGSPMADSKGYVTGSNVSQVNEMVDLIDSSNSYSASVAVLQQASRVDQQMLSSFQVTS
jgi:flagellar basal-body rod protein FlgC